MSWADLLVIVGIVGIWSFYSRGECGRALLDTVAVLAASHMSRLYAETLGGRMGWQGPANMSGPHPHLQALLLVAFLGLGLAFARLLHSRSRWSMDQFDVLFNSGFALVIAVTLAHVTLDLAARHTVMTLGRSPRWIQESVLADELTHFRTYRMVVGTLNEARYRRE